MYGISAVVTNKEVYAVHCKQFHADKPNVQQVKTYNSIIEEEINQKLSPCVSTSSPPTIALTIRGVVNLLKYTFYSF